MLGQCPTTDPHPTRHMATSTPAAISDSLGPQGASLPLQHALWAVLPPSSQVPTPGVPMIRASHTSAPDFFSTASVDFFFLVVLERGGPQMPTPACTQAALGIVVPGSQRYYSLCLCQDLVACLLAGMAPLRQRNLDTP